MDRLSRIDGARLRDLAGRMFHDTPLTVSSVGPVQHLPSKEEIARTLRRSLH